MATTARLLPSIKPQMALQTLPQFIFQGALRDHHLENNKSAKIRGEQRALKITAKCSLLTIGSKHIIGWEASTYPRWTLAAGMRGITFNVPLVWNFYIRRHALPFSIHPPILPTQTFTGLNQIYSNCQSQGWQTNSSSLHEFTSQASALLIWP